MTSVELLWADLLMRHDRPVFTRIDETHPLDLYVGMDVGDARVLMLVCDQEPTESPSYEVIEIISHRRADDRWVLLVRLKKQELGVPFSRLCQDLVDSSRAGTGGMSPAEFLLRRLARWHKLLQMDHTGLTDAEAKGLIGELLFLQRHAIPYSGIAPAVDGWIGPEGALQDFRIAGNLIEVKTCQLGTERITISGVGQLDADGPLYLIVVVISPSPQGAPDAMTLCHLVRQLRELIEVDLAAACEFELRLAHARFKDDDKAASVAYMVNDVRAYQVRPSFPRVTRANTPPGVLEVRYAVDLHACSEFQCDIGAIGHVDL